MRAYRPPGRRPILVDRALEPAVLDQLNRLRHLEVDETCAGHARGPERHARVAFVASRRRRRGRAEALRDFAPYLERLSATDYRARISRYRSNGGPTWWRLEVRREAPGQAPRAWWRELAALLTEEAP